MFPFGGNPYAPRFSSYNPYEEARLQQELQQRRQAEEYYRRRQIEELNRRRAEQLEYARRQAELQRCREAEARYRHQQELEARRRKFSEPSHPRTPHVRVQRPAGPDEWRRSMFGGGTQDLFDALYGNRFRQSPSSSYGRRSKSSDPRARHPRTNPAWTPAEEVSEPEDSAVSDTEDGDEEVAPPTTATEHTSQDVPEMAQAAVESSNPEAIKSHSAISDILKSFSDLKAGFTFPAKPDFLNKPADSDTVTPKLAYTPNNAPLHQYEHLLTGLLTKLDAVDSYGQDSIRKERKDAVRQIEQELEELDIKKLQAWREQFKEAAVTHAPPTTSVEIPGTTHRPGSETQAEVDPASIPLPRDEDLETNSSAGTSSPTSSDSIVTPVRDLSLLSILTENEGKKEAAHYLHPDPLAPGRGDDFSRTVETGVILD